MNQTKILKKWAFYLGTAILAACSLAAVSMLWLRPSVLAVVMALIAVAMLAIRFSRQELLFFAMAGVAGALAEVVGIYSGAWVYFVRETPYVPFWLPLLWGVAGIFLTRMREAISDLFS